MVAYTKILNHNKKIILISSILTYLFINILVSICFEDSNKQKKLLKSATIWKSNWFIVHKKLEMSCLTYQIKYPDWSFFVINTNTLSDFRSTDYCMDNYDTRFLHFVKNYNLTGLPISLQSILFVIKNGAKVIYQPTNFSLDQNKYLKEVTYRLNQKMAIYYTQHSNNISCQLDIDNLKLCNEYSHPIIFYKSNSFSINSKKHLNGKIYSYYDTSFNIRGLTFGDGILDHQLSHPIYTVNSFWLLFFYHLEEINFTKNELPIYTNKLEIPVSFIISFLIDLLNYPVYIVLTNINNHKYNCINNLTLIYLSKIYKQINIKISDKKTLDVDDLLIIVQKLFGNGIMLKFKIWLNTLNNIDYKYKLYLKSNKQKLQCSNKIDTISYSGLHLSHEATFNEICNSTSFNSILPQKLNFDLTTYNTMPNVLLIIVFNKPHYEVVHLMELLHRSRFPNIVYCGPSLPIPSKYFSFFRQNTFLTFDNNAVNATDGAFNYECTVKAIDMGINYDGYLSISDDLLLYDDLSLLSVDKIWFQPLKLVNTYDYQLGMQCVQNSCVFYPHWRWFIDYKIQVMHLLRDMSNNDKETISNCYRNLMRFNNGAMFRVHGAYSDIYYIPNQYARQFAEIARTFLSHQVFVEIAVPTIIICLSEENSEETKLKPLFDKSKKLTDKLENKENSKDNLHRYFKQEVEELKGLEVWDKDRDKPWKYWNKALQTGMYLHPTKWSHLFISRKSEHVKISNVKSQALNKEMLQQVIIKNLPVNDLKDDTNKQVFGERNKLQLQKFICQTVIPYMFKYKDQF